MAKRVGVILCGCGGPDGTDAAEALLTLLILDRAGAQAICAAPAAARADAVRLLPAGTPDADLRPLESLDARDLDALIVPGGGGATTVLSDYAQKGQLCQVNADLSRLLRALLPAKRPMAFMGLAAVPAARVLGPVAGVRLTLGSKAFDAAKHAAIMGADIRPATAEDVIVDQKARVFSTPGFLAEGARLAQVARAIDRLVRQMLSVTRGTIDPPSDVAPAPAAQPQAQRRPQQPPATPNPAEPIRRRRTGG